MEKTANYIDKLLLQVYGDAISRHDNALTGDEGIGIDKFANFPSEMPAILNGKFVYYQRNFLLLILFHQNIPQVLELVGGTWLSLVKKHIA